MRFNKKTLKKIKQDCNFCKSSFTVWLTTLNFDKDKEENIKRRFYNHCPSCKALGKTKQ